MVENCLRLIARNYRRKCGNISLFDGLHTAKMLQQPASRVFAHSGDFAQLRGAIAHLPAFAMEGHSKAVGFVADQLDQMQNRRMMIERDRVRSPAHTRR